MQTGILYKNVGDVLSSPGGVVSVPGYALYTVEHAHKGQDGFTNWKEVMIIMGTTTFDLYEVEKSLGSLVPGSYATSLAQPNALLISSVKYPPPFSYYMLITETDANAIISPWSSVAP